MEQKPVFNLHLTYEDALRCAEDFQASYQKKTQEDLTLWANPRDLYGQRIKFRTDFFYKENTFVDDVKEEFEVGVCEVEARAALFWLIDRHKGFNPLELGEIIVGVRNPGGFGEDRELAIFTFISGDDDCMRDFIREKAFELTRK